MQNNFKTKDIYEASVLIASQARLLHLEQDTGFFWFVFEDFSYCEQISNQYWRNELTLPAKTLTDAIRSLKDQLFSRRN